MKARLQAVRKQYWETRPASERRLILVSSGIVLPVLVYLLLWQPVGKEVAKLHKSVPKLQVQAERMQRWSKDIEALRHSPKIAALDSSALKSSVEESAVRHKIKGAIGAIDIKEPNGVRVSLASVSFEHWLEWLRSLQQEQHIRVESISVAPLNEPGMVTLRATLVSGADQ